MQGMFGPQGMFGSSPNPVNCPASRPTPASQSGTNGLSGASQAVPNIPASRPSQGVPPVDGEEDAVSACLLRVLEVLPDVPPETITAMMDDATLCRKGVKSYSEEIINQLVELRSDLTVGSTPHSNFGNLGRSTGTQRVPIVDWEMPPPPYQDQWREGYTGPGNHIPGPSQQRPPLQVQWRGGNPGNQIPGPTQQRPPFQGQWPGGPAGPGFHIPGPLQQQPPYQDQWLGGPTRSQNPIPGSFQQYPPHQDQWRGLPTTGIYNPSPVQQGPFPPYELSGESSGRAEYPVASTPPNNGPQNLPRSSPPTQPVRPWHNPYADPPYLASGMVPRPRPPHEAMASANFSGARPDFLSEVLERGLVTAGPPDYVQRGYSPVRQHTPSPPARTQSPYTPDAYVSSPNPFPPPQNGRRVSFGDSPNAAFGSRNPYAGHEQYGRSGRSEDQPSSYVVQRDDDTHRPIRRRNDGPFYDERRTAFAPELSPITRPSTRQSEDQPSRYVPQRDGDVNRPIRRRKSVSFWDERPSVSAPEYPPSPQAPTRRSEGHLLTHISRREEDVDHPIRRRNTAPLYNERDSPSPQNNHRVSYIQPPDTAFGSREHPYAHDERYENERYTEPRPSSSHQPSVRFVQRNENHNPPLRRQHTGPSYTERPRSPDPEHRPRRPSTPANIGGRYNYVDADEVRDRLSRADEAVRQHEDSGSGHGDRGPRTWRNV
ncbi:Serine/arginine repetitive matrix protein 1 [Curvularia kusanoi]|uniref:Serine/arginine repetitive matrix protein 1 n=1 Tax=Curvularia kusanoi TaxID=90978 RepID=A0A9P4T7L7_CURKU|nr:Serine/arginine repetitive matrix protein 1 [Curvularia kusanoi]